MPERPGVAAVADQLQYVHLEKLYGYLPGIADAVPGIFGLTHEEYVAVRDRFDAQARAAAEELVADSVFARRLARLPFEPGARVLAVGDSITDDLQSWAEILRHALARTGPDVTVVNAGLSAHTTAMVLRRWPSLLHPAPDWIVCALGGNDVTRIAGGKPQVALPESVANLRELRRIAAERASVQWVWLTPVPVDEERAGRHPAFRFGSSSWRNADLVALADALAAAVDDPVVDLVSPFGVPADPALQGPDGVHPSLAGQQQIVRSLVARLSP
ncbi:SGNH/GDSL hydrolase family protein [Mumia sp. DW29H23]|uniref:SGNH/GDSL hydrolase family protein n=1 Tax=Mumia sp. DW29H23 TaxID=3421241 RepID=UPI003D6927F9